MVALTTALEPIGVFEVSHGTVSLTACTPRELLIRACLCGAARIAVAHNHPSGNTRPSPEDRRACRRLQEACGVVGIGLDDFIIIGDLAEGGFFSFAEQDLL